MKVILKMFYHYAEKPFDLDRERDYSDKYDSDSGDVHVQAYGLWLSVGDAWKQWAEASNFPVGNVRYKVEFDDSKVLILDTKEKVADFNQKYGENGSIGFRLVMSFPDLFLVRISTNFALDIGGMGVLMCHPPVFGISLSSRVSSWSKRICPKFRAINLLI